MNSKRVGDRYEQEAADFLKKKEYAIVDRNVRFDHKEIDIVAVKNNLLVFIEVKYRKMTKHWNPFASISPLKQERIKICAQHYLMNNEWTKSYYCRYDAIIITNDGAVHHFENAFQ